MHLISRTATVNFMTEDDARESLEKSKNAKLEGKPLTVLYSHAKEQPKKSKSFSFFCAIKAGVIVFRFSGKKPLSY